MKHIVCEMCGGTDLVKQEGLFVCQNCNSKYSVEEAKKMMVEIDHSAEIENLLARAEQFKNSGDTDTALEYYNKVLDLDAKNETALEAIDDLTTEIYVVEKNRSTRECIESFLSYLGKDKRTVPDVLSGIEIKSVTEKSYPFRISVSECSVDFFGTACYNREEIYTDYKEKAVTVNGKTEWVKEPVTKTRTVVDRQPARGSFNHTVHKTLVASNALNRDLTPYSSEEAVALLSEERTITEIDLIKDLENTINGSLSDLDLIKINPSSPQVAGDFCEIAHADDEEDRIWAVRIVEEEEDAVRFWSYVEAEHNCPGDFSEDLNVDTAVTAQKDYLAYIPVQVIVYEYRGERFAAAQLMNKASEEVAVSYPISKERFESEVDRLKSVNETKEEIKSLTYAKYCAIGTAIALFLGWISDADVGIFFKIVGFALLAVTIYLFTNGKKEEKARMKKADEIKVSLAHSDSSSAKRISESKKIFLDALDSSGDYDKAVKAVCKKYPPLDSIEFLTFVYDEVNGLMFIRNDEDEINDYNDYNENGGTLVVITGERSNEDQEITVSLNGKTLATMGGCDRICVPVEEYSTFEIYPKGIKEPNIINIARDELKVVLVEFQFIGIGINEKVEKISNLNSDTLKYSEFEQESLEEFARIKAEKKEKIKNALKFNKKK